MAAAATAATVFATPATPATRPVTSIVAQARVSTVDVYRIPGAKRPFVELRNPNAVGGPLVFLVVQRTKGWERVLLPRRPNGSTGWVRDRSVALALDPYRVVVSLHSHSLQVWKGAKPIHTEKAGVGRSVLPTPLGTYYLVDLLKQPDPSGPYGPYAFGTSAFSNVLYSFGGGPGQIGLHGTDDPSTLGTSVSHGCIRISNAGITQLAHLLPLGTPVRIAP
ncbi:MAG TPA: L,D-transpeptidase [Gaiellaceae bacterium]|nr:L,D-transpeptidase [Gaiellaceae bacterium]